MITIDNNITDFIVLQYPSQVCCLGLLYYWTRECEYAVADIKNDRKALQNLSKKFSAVMTRLPTILYRGAWKTIDAPMLPVHKLRLENMITVGWFHVHKIHNMFIVSDCFCTFVFQQALYLRDCLESMTTRKIREPTDFEWRRNMRCYIQEHGERPSRCTQKALGPLSVLAVAIT